MFRSLIIKRIFFNAAAVLLSVSQFCFRFFFQSVLLLSGPQIRGAVPSGGEG